MRKGRTNVNKFCPNHQNGVTPPWAVRVVGARAYCAACADFLEAPPVHVQRQIETLIAELEAIKAARL
jgi:hypothetical protein